MIKVLVPSAPKAEALLPYLKRIDDANWYTNSGPLVREFEGRMGGVSVSSATLGIELAAKCLFRFKRVRIPAFTFVATATALIRAGFEPVLCDVDENWTLVSPDAQSLAVCPFGASVKHSGLVDAAAAWGNQSEGIRVFSLHATKALSAGEGGMVCGPKDLQERIRKLANFGLDASRLTHGVVTEAGTNAKMSEYHAAVGLASLDAWPEISARRAAMAEAYRDRLGSTVSFQPRDPESVYTTFPITVRNAEQVAFDMASRGVETRRWYTPTLDKHPAFQHLPKEGDLSNAHRLGGEVLCLPFHLHLTDSDIEQVCEVFEWARDRNSGHRISQADLCGEARPYA